MRRWSAGICRLPLRGVWSLTYARAKVSDTPPASPQTHPYNLLTHRHSMSRYVSRHPNSSHHIASHRTRLRHISDLSSSTKQMGLCDTRQIPRQILNRWTAGSGIEFCSFAPSWCSRGMLRGPSSTWHGACSPPSLPSGHWESRILPRGACCCAQGRLPTRLNHYVSEQPTAAIFINYYYYYFVRGPSNKICHCTAI